MNDETAAGPEPTEPSPKSFWRLESLREVGRGRIIRLGVLIGVLFALFAGYVFLRVYTARLHNQREARVAAALAQARTIIGLLKPNMSAEELQQLFQQANASLQLVKELDPQNMEADCLAVPLCYASGYLDDAIGFFNSLDVFKASEQMAPALFSRASERLNAFDMLKPEAGSPLMTPADRHYIRACSYLWGLAYEITSTAGNDAEKAVRLARWMALHILPGGAEETPGDPYIVIMRGHASAAEAAWTYAELARQARLHARVLVPPADATGGAAEEIVVQVRPSEGPPLLIAPFAGVPVVNLDSGDLVPYEQALDAPDILSRLRDLPGGAGLPTADRLRKAQERMAVAIESCFPRMLVFGHLLDPLWQKPEIGLSLADSAEGDALLWDQPVTIRQEMGAQGASDVALQDFRYLDPSQPGRILQVRGLHEPAKKVYADRIAELTAQADAAETEESAATLREAVEFATFASASNALDGSDYASAEALARRYIENYPSGRWHPLAVLILAEALTAEDKAAEAKDLWQQVTGPRRLYAELRARGLLTGSPALVPPARPPAPAEGGQPDAP